MHNNKNIRAYKFPLVGRLRGVCSSNYFILEEDIILTWVSKKSFNDYNTTSQRKCNDDKHPALRGRQAY